MDYGREPSFLYLQRYKCPECNKLHTVIPKNICPYKHYKKTVIRDVIYGFTYEGDLKSENGPSDETMERWRGLYNKEDF